MFIYKKLKASDANTIAFEAHKEWNISGANTSSLGITRGKGRSAMNITGPQGLGNKSLTLNKKTLLGG